MPTKDELERENEQLRARVAELEEQMPAKAGEPRRPERLTDPKGKTILSAGEADDLRVRGVTVSPFNGEELNALDEGIEPATPEARRNAEKARERKKARLALTDPAAARLNDAGAAEPATID